MISQRSVEEDAVHCFKIFFLGLFFTVLNFLNVRSDSGFSAIAEFWEFINFINFLPFASTQNATVSKT